MIFLATFSFLAGLVTALSPCILPLLPLILSGSVGTDHRRPAGVILGFVASFTFFTLALSSLIRILGIPADTLRLSAIVLIGFLGLTLFIPSLSLWFEHRTAWLVKRAPRQNLNPGFLNGCLVGISLGLVWTPCAGPILSAVITLAATSTVTLISVLITLSFALGTAIPLSLIALGGQRALTRSAWLVERAGAIQKLFGILMLITAGALALGLDRSLQTTVIEKFPTYTQTLQSIDANDRVQTELKKLFPR